MAADDVEERAARVRALPAPLPRRRDPRRVRPSSACLARAALVGGAGTPYAGGFFAFDVYLPATFPEVSPLVQFLTTAGGTFRFNANLYADGKVCLSLLGTWHGTDKTEKWQPGTSTVAQVLLSIATQILCAEPDFNEPGYADARGTPHGRAASQAYDDELRVGTVRHAMIAPIRAPRKGSRCVPRALPPAAQAAARAGERVRAARRARSTAPRPPAARRATRRAISAAWR